MPDSARGIRTSVEDHAMLVVRGPKSRHQPFVGLAPGSSSRSEEPGMPLLTVMPADVEPAGALVLATRFFLHRASRFPVASLGRRIGRLHGAKLEELRRLRGLGI